MSNETMTDARDLVIGELEQWFDTQGVDVGSAADSVIAALSAAPAPVAGDAVAVNDDTVESVERAIGYRTGRSGHADPKELIRAAYAALAQDRASQAGSAGGAS